jgi:integrase
MKTKKMSVVIKNYLQSETFKSLSEKSQKDYQYFLSKWYSPELLAKDISTLTTPMWQSLYDKTYAETPSTANHSLAVWRALFKYAVGEGWIKYNPVREVDSRLSKRRSVCWTREDISRFLNVAYSRFEGRSIGLIVQMAHEWGQRVGDLRVLQWDNYCLQTGNVTIGKTKRKEATAIPSSKELMAMLSKQYEDYGWQKYVVPSSKPDGKGGLLPYTETGVSKIANKIKEAAGVAFELQLSDLKRTALTEMLEYGVPLHNIMSITGHSSPYALSPYIKHSLALSSEAMRMRKLIE